MRSAPPVYSPRVIRVLKISIVVAVLGYSLPGHAAEEAGNAAPKPAPAQQEKKSGKPSSTKAPKSADKKKPAAKSAGTEQKPATKPCEEVKPCAIE